MSDKKSAPPILKLVIGIPLLLFTGYAIYEIATHEPKTKGIKYDEALAGYYWDLDSMEWLYNPNWTPNDLAAELKYVMDVTTVPLWGETPRSDAWIELATRHPEALKWLHNYWNEFIDATRSVYEWIDNEVVIPYSLEETAQKEALTALTDAGVSSL